MERGPFGGACVCVGFPLVSYRIPLLASLNSADLPGQHHWEGILHQDPQDPSQAASKSYSDGASPACQVIISSPEGT